MTDRQIPFFRIRRLVSLSPAAAASRRRRIMECQDSSRAQGLRTKPKIQ